MKNMMVILCAPEATDDLDQLDIESITDIDEKFLIASGYGEAK